MMEVRHSIVCLNIEKQNKDRERYGRVKKWKSRRLLKTGRSD